MKKNKQDKLIDNSKEKVEEINNQFLGASNIAMQKEKYKQDLNLQRAESQLGLYPNLSNINKKIINPQIENFNIRPSRTLPYAGIDTWRQEVEKPFTELVVIQGWKLIQVGVRGPYGTDIKLASGNYYITHDCKDQSLGDSVLGLLDSVKDDYKCGKCERVWTKSIKNLFYIYLETAKGIENDK